MAGVPGYIYLVEPEALRVARGNHFSVTDSIKEWGC